MQLAILWAALLAACGGIDDHATPFFAFDNGVGRDKWTPQQQAAALSDLGYDGIGYTGGADLDARLAAFDAAGLRVFSIYVHCYVDRDPAFAPELLAAIDRLRGTDVIIWLTVQGQAADDANAVAAVRSIADHAAAAGLRVALYPHYGFYVADIEDALRVVEQVDRDNVGLTFNLCHELRAGNAARFDELLERAAPHLYLVSLNGADHEGEWDKLIQPLGAGAFDVRRVLRKLDAIGYNGPVGLQCYQVPGDIRANLEKSMAAWKQLRDEQNEGAGE